MDSASLQIGTVDTRSAVPPQETVVHKHSHTDTALATYRTETIQALSPSPPSPCPPHLHRQVPGSSQGIFVCLSPSCGEKSQRKSLFALFCIEWSPWNVRNVFSKGRSRETVNRCIVWRHQRAAPPHPSVQQINASLSPPRGGVPR